MKIRNSKMLKDPRHAFRTVLRKLQMTNRNWFNKKLNPCFFWNTGSLDLTSEGLMKTADCMEQLTKPFEIQLIVLVMFI